MSTRGVTKPKLSQTMIINDPHKPRRSYKPSELSLKVAKDKQKVERAREAIELDAELKEVWE